MKKRVFIFDDMEAEVKSNMRGGKGEIHSRVVIPAGEPLAPGSPFVASGINSIMPGASIGVHKHVLDEEVYVIISGSGHYIDNDGKRHPVKAGDIAYCCKGEEHGMENTGSEPLVFGAVIAK